MRKLVVLLALLIPASKIFSQKANDVFYVFKNDWSSAKNLDDATYFMQAVQQNDTTFVCRYYKKFGPMAKQETYKDAELTIPNGLFAWYTAAGNIDSLGDVVAGHKDGEWRSYFDSSKAQVVTYYAEGKRIKTVDYRVKKEYYPDGTIKDVQEDKKDSTEDKHVYVKAEYPGGEKAWTKYLTKNLQTPERFQQITRNGACKVIVTFSIDRQGAPVDVQIGKSCEWSADTEAVRIIKAGGKWKPASIDGRNVIYRQRQSITFQVSSN